MPQQLPLTRGYTALVDDSDFSTLSQWKWLYVGSGYAGRFVIINGQKSLVYLHRFLLNAKREQRVDHINGNRLDCRRENLRLANTRQNVQNRRCSSHSTSGKKGVYWHRRNRKWHVRITVKGIRLHLGYYDDLETAALLYDAAARRFFREYAHPNYPARPTPHDIQILLDEVLSRQGQRVQGALA